MGPTLGNLDPYSGTRTRLCTQLWIWPVLVYVLKFPSKNFSYFLFCLVNVLNPISMPIIDALLLCHDSWVIGIESGHKKIGSSQRYEVKKLAQYRWDIRYFSGLICIKILRWRVRAVFRQLLFSLFHGGPKWKSKIPAKTNHCFFEFFPLIPPLWNNENKSCLNVSITWLVQCT